MQVSLEEAQAGLLGPEWPSPQVGARCARWTQHDRVPRRMGWQAHARCATCACFTAVSRLSVCRLSSACAQVLLGLLQLCVNTSHAASRAPSPALRHALMCHLSCGVELGGQGCRSAEPRCGGQAWDQLGWDCSMKACCAP